MNYPMNEQLKLAETYFIPHPFKADTQFGTKKRKTDRTTLIFLSYHKRPQTTGIYKKNNFFPVNIPYQCPGDPTTYLLFIRIKEIVQRAD